MTICTNWDLIQEHLRLRKNNGTQFWLTMSKRLLGNNVFLIVLIVSTGVELHHTESCFWYVIYNHLIWYLILLHDGNKILNIYLFIRCSAVSLQQTPTARISIVKKNTSVTVCNQPECLIVFAFHIFLFSKRSNCGLSDYKYIYENCRLYF